MLFRSQRFTGDVNILPGYGVFSVGKLLSMLEEDEMIELLKAGERATWSKIPLIRTTTRIGRTLDRILLAFEADEAHWLRTGPHTDVAKKQGGRRRPSAPAKAKAETRSQPETRPRVKAGTGRQQVCAETPEKVVPIARAGRSKAG